LACQHRISHLGALFVSPHPHSLFAVPPQCPRLQTIVLERCPSFGDAELVALMAASPLLHSAAFLDCALARPRVTAHRNLVRLAVAAGRPRADASGMLVLAAAADAERARGKVTEGTWMFAEFQIMQVRTKMRNEGERECVLDGEGELGR